MNKSLQGISYDVDSTSYQNLRPLNHSYLFQVNLPFYPSALLLCCDNIKYWSIGAWLNDRTLPGMQTVVLFRQKHFTAIFIMVVS